jgi:hypothetical protein
MKPSPCTLLLESFPKKPRTRSEASWFGGSHKYKTKTNFLRHFFPLYSHKQKFLKNPLSPIPIHTCACEYEIGDTGSHFRVSGFCWSTSSRVSSFSVSLFLDIHPQTHTHTNEQSKKILRVPGSESNP